MLENTSKKSIFELKSVDFNDFGWNRKTIAENEVIYCDLDPSFQNSDDDETKGKNLLRYFRDELLDLGVEQIEYQASGEGDDQSFEEFDITYNKDVILNSVREEIKEVIENLFSDIILRGITGHHFDGAGGSCYFEWNLISNNISMQVYLNDEDCQDAYYSVFEEPDSFLHEEASFSL